jgi:Methyltransferase domain
MLLVILLVVAVIALAFAIPGLSAAPYVPILGRDVNRLLDLSEIKSGQTLIDLGSGDGYLLRGAARRGVKCIGYEINPVMVVISKILCFKYRKLISIRLANFWDTKLPPADAVYIFLMPAAMDHLDRKLQSELKTKTTVVSYAFQIPGRTIIRKTQNSFVYEYPAS